MHMIQHQASAGARIDLARFTALQEDYALLSAELAQHQHRYARSLADKTRNIASAPASAIRD